MLQLMMNCGVLAEDITPEERRDACAFTRLELCEDDGLQPKNTEGVPDNLAFLEHSRHGPSIWEKLYEFFAGRLGTVEMPRSGAVLIVEGRLDTEWAPADEIAMAGGLTQVEGAAIEVRAFNWTGEWCSGWHYDPAVPTDFPPSTTIDLDGIGLSHNGSAKDTGHAGTSPPSERDPEEGGSSAPRRKRPNDSWSTYFRAWEKHSLGVRSGNRFFQRNKY